MVLFPLGNVKELVEAAGMGISYAYEDLVFLDHSGFLLQFAETGSTMIIHTNIEAQQEEIEAPISSLKKKASLFGLKIIDGNQFQMNQTENDEIRIKFYE